MKRLLPVVLACLCSIPAAVAQSAATFTNPLLSVGPDPWVTSRDGFYYYMNSTGSNLTIWKTRDITDLRNAEKTVVWTPPSTGPYSKELWAPELHWLDGKWYLYFAADAGENEGHRVWVLENASPDPTKGEWTMKGKLDDGSDKWAIDPSVFTSGGKNYVIWAGWPGDTNGVQNIYIARLKNPWTIEGKRVRLSTPEYPWEKVGDLDPQNRIVPVPHVDVNEGPEILEHANRIFLVYSASGCWTNYYELGMLSAEQSSDLLDARSWKKSPDPVFRQSPEAHAFGTGHNAFFQSPDGKEDWIIYHANPEADEGCDGKRSPRAQPVHWNADGTPDFGKPVPLGQAIPKPSGTKE
ncbi:family 43 glycosylhydrolase [Silvibacterium sp.]|uniref:glycoside hydrolase family 43 protein n=1 Tax=Silvibacterium sp. TaxID=1964179 RepID=UPI0039E498E2